MTNETQTPMGLSAKYEGLTRAQLIRLLVQRDNERKLGLVWERDEIDADSAIDKNFVIADLIKTQSDRSAPWENLIIEGDNYDALRWLRMAYRGKVKCIYIDPPYNTGNKDWVYNDSYVDPNHRYRHSQWLEFLFQRLSLARDLLAPDGVLLCSINDENRAKLELMMDQALPGMRLGSLTWRTRVGGNEGGDAFFSQNHEHVLIFGRPDFEFVGAEKSFDMYKYNDDDGNGPWRKDNLTVPVYYLDKRAGKAYFPLLDTNRNVWYPCNPDAVWRYASKKLSGQNSNIKTSFMEDFIANGQILFPENARVDVFETKEALLNAIRSGDVPSSGRAPLLREDLPDLDFWVGKKIGWGTPAFKRYKKDLRNQNQPLSSWVTPNAESDTIPEGANMIISGTNDEGAKIIKDVFGEKAFNYAKPVSLIRELVRQSTSAGDLVMDFFAGSATTAQAVMALNAEDGGARRFIMVSSTEATTDDPEKNICRDVTAERVRRLNANTDKYAELSAGFAYLACREINPLDIDTRLTAANVWSILEAFHGLPLTAWHDGDLIAIHEAENTIVVLIDEFQTSMSERINALGPLNKPIFLYAFEAGQVQGLDASLSIEVHGVRDTMRKLWAA